MRHIQQYLTTNRKVPLLHRETNHLMLNNLFNVVKISKNQLYLLLKDLIVLIHPTILAKKFKNIAIIKPILVRHKHHQDRVQHRLRLTINQWTISSKHMMLERKNYKRLRSFLQKVNLTLRLSVRRQNCLMNKIASCKNKFTS